MENLTFEATKYTPEINLDAKGTISLVGKSYPENTFEFYAPMMKWLEEYFEGNAAGMTTVNMEITYFNSSSSKLFFDFFDLLEENCEDNTIEVNWIYDAENESAEEAGEDFIEDFESLKIKLVEK
jgi:SiaC family regulatory phosphoprotein